MDINLLRERKTPPAVKKPRPEPTSPPALTDPRKEPAAPPEPKAPSRLSLWWRSLRQRRAEVEPAKPPEIAPIVRPAKPPEPIMASPLSAPAPEDIFAELDEPTIRPSSTPPIRPPAEPAVIRQTAKIDEPITSPATPSSSVPTPVIETAPEKLPAMKKIKKARTEQSNRGSLVNLLPSEFRQEIDPRSKIITLGITILICLSFIGGAYALLTVYRTSILEKIQTLRSERTDVDVRISSLRPKQREAIAMNRRLENVRALLDQHIYWTKFFAKLEKYTIDDVYYTGALVGSLGGQMTLSATGTSFTSPARQLLALEAADDFVSKVQITSATATETSTADLPPGSTPEQSVVFTVNLTLVPDIFSYTASTFPSDRAGGTAVGPTVPTSPINYPGSYPGVLPSNPTNTNQSTNQNNP